MGERGYLIFAAPRNRCGHRCRAAALRDLTPEVRSNNDLLFVRGAEEYRNLPNKTLRLLLYVLSSRERCAFAVLPRGAHSRDPQLANMPQQGWWRLPDESGHEQHQRKRVALCRYTHVLKTDDDCYVRLKPLIATLRRGDAQYAGYGVESGRYRDRGVYTGELPAEACALLCAEQFSISCVGVQIAFAP